MDVDFLKQLDEQISNVGTSECWKRKVGDRTIWISPIPVTSQTKINDTLANAELGPNVLIETKRVTLSHAVVGIDDIDLRQYRFSGPVFDGGYDPRVKSDVKLDLSGYLYKKMATWGSEFIDNTFDVFADLMETHKQKNLKDVKFENAKDPITELAELEARAGEIRARLNMPFLVEATQPEDTESVTKVPPTSHEPEEPSPEPEEPPVAFDPFATLQKPGNPPPAQRQAPPPQEAPEPIPRPTVTVPVPAPSIVPNSRARRIAQEFGANKPIIGRESSPDNPFRATPSVASEVVETPASKAPVAPPVLNPVDQNINPRFHRR